MEFFRGNARAFKAFRKNCMLHITMCMMVSVIVVVPSLCYGQVTTQSDLPSQQSKTITIELKKGAAEILHPPASALELEAARRDIDAQEAMAFWGKIAVIVSGVATALTLVGAWFIKKTFNLTQVQMRTDLRPYLAIDQVKFIPIPAPQGELLGLEVKFANYGRTPAQNVRLRYRGRFHKPGNDFDFGVDLAKASTHTLSVVVPEQEHQMTVLFQKRYNEAEIIDSDDVYFAFGDIVYEGLGDTFTTEYRHVFGLENTGRQSLYFHEAKAGNSFS